MDEKSKNTRKKKNKVTLGLSIYLWEFLKKYYEKFQTYSNTESILQLMPINLVSTIINIYMYIWVVKNWKTSEDLVFKLKQLTEVTLPPEFGKRLSIMHHRYTYTGVCMLMHPSRCTHMILFKFNHWITYGQIILNQDIITTRKKQ